MAEGEETEVSVAELVATIASFVLLIFTFPFSLLFCVTLVYEYERVIIFRLGRLLGGDRGPGLVFFLTCIDNYEVVDLRTVSFNVPAQEVLTKDSVTVTVDAVVYYKIFDPMSAIVKVANFSTSTQLLAMTILRNILGTHNLAELLSDREKISYAMKKTLDDATDPWGVKVERVEIKDVSLPQQLQKAMATEAEAAREARAKIIAAEGEMNASKALNKAAEIIKTSPSAIQLRYLQTLSNIAAARNQTVVFPLPTELIASFMKH